MLGLLTQGLAEARDARLHAVKNFGAPLMSAVTGAITLYQSKLIYYDHGHGAGPGRVSSFHYLFEKW